MEEVEEGGQEDEDDDDEDDDDGHQSPLPWDGVGGGKGGAAGAGGCFAVFVVVVFVLLGRRGGKGAAAALQLPLQLLGGGLKWPPPAHGPDPKAGGKAGRGHVRDDHV